MDIFEIYALTVFRSHGLYRLVSYELLDLLNVADYHFRWYIYKCDIIEGLYYPKQLIARSADVV